MTATFVFLSKFLPPLIYPLGLVSLFLVLILFLRRRTGWVIGLASLALVVLLLASNRWVSYALARPLEWSYLPQEDLPVADAIVVLGGGTESANYPRQTVELNSAGDRLIYAAQLYRDGKAPAVLVSGGKIDWLDPSEQSQAEEMATLLEMLGVPPQAVWRQDRSQNTAEDAAFSAELLAQKDAGRILLVTSALHMPRSLALFEKLDLEVFPASADFNVTQARWDALRHPSLQGFLVNLLPNASSLNLTTNALKEYIGMVVYRLQGWL